MDEAILCEAGLTPGEAKVYLALLELGESTSGPIVSQSGVAKSIIYQLLTKLSEKGLVSYIVKEKTKYYQAAEPAHLLDVVAFRQKELEKSKARIEALLPELLAKAQSSEKSVARIFEGFKGMITVHEHMYEKLTKGDEFFYMGIPAHQPKHFHAYWNKDHKRRVKAGIVCKMLFSQDTDKGVLINRNSYKLCDSRYMPVDIRTPAWFFGYKDVAVIGFPSSFPITLEIVNKEIARSFRAYFDTFWKQSKVFKG